MAVTALSSAPRTRQNAADHVRDDVGYGREGMSALNHYLSFSVFMFSEGVILRDIGETA